MHVTLAIRLHPFPLFLLPLCLLLKLLRGLGPREICGDKELLFLVFVRVICELRRDRAWFAIRRQGWYAVEEAEAAPDGG